MGGDSADAVARAETAKRVATLVLALQEPYRTTVVLRYFEGLSYQDVAEVLGVRPGTVKSRLNRAHTILREELGSAHCSREAG